MGWGGLLVSRRSAALAAVFSALVLAAVALSGALHPLEAQLRGVMRSQPLPPGYFQVFMLGGTLVPLALRLWFRRVSLVITLLDPYLILLLGQILSEILLVLLVGPGLGVIVGFWFTLLRLLQLMRLRPRAAALPWLQVLLSAELLLWLVNAAHILLRRLLPLGLNLL